MGSAETAIQPRSSYIWPASKRRGRRDNLPSISVGRFPSERLTPEAQSTFAAIDFLSVADQANEAAPLQPAEDLEK
jgi:hypothetical protein